MIYFTEISESFCLMVLFITLVYGKELKVKNSKFEYLGEP